MRASGRARRSGVGAYGASASNSGGLVANIFAGPAVRGGALLRRHNGFKLFLVKSELYARVLGSGAFLDAQVQGF